MYYIVQWQKWNWGAFEPGQELLFTNSFAGERLDTSRTSFAHVHAGTCQSGHFILIGDRVFQWVFEKNVFLRENCERKLLFLRISNIQSKAIFAEGSDMLIIMLKLKWKMMMTNSMIQLQRWQIQWQWYVLFNVVTWSTPGGAAVLLVYQQRDHDAAPAIIAIIIGGFYLREISSIKVCTPAEEEAIALKACGNKYKYCKKIVCRCPKQRENDTNRSVSLKSNP